MAVDPFVFNATTGAQDKYTAGAVTPEGDNDSSLERDRAKQAADAGVKDVRFLGYAEVLSLYADRADVETLAERRARHLGTDPGQQSFTRAADYDAGAGTAADPQTSFPESGNWAEEDFTPAPDEPAGP